jgi:hypothetical protein
VIEPGTPAARFLAASPVEPTIPTVAAKPAPAPTAVAGLNLAKTAPAKPTAAPATAKAAPATAPTKVARKSAAQIRAEKRAAAKAAAKASTTAAKARSQKRIAARDDADDDEDDAPVAKKPAAAKGKGVLQIASTPAMEVWVDGRNSKAQTPVRIILLAGKHKVTLFDKEHGGKARTFEIEIRPDETTKVSKSY